MEMAQTELMQRYNEIASGYEKAVLHGDSLLVVRCAKRVMEFLIQIDGQERMYGEGDKWVTAGDLLECNKRRIERLERGLYSLQIRKTNKRGTGYE